MNMRHLFATLFRLAHPDAPDGEPALLANVPDDPHAFGQWLAREVAGRLAHYSPVDQSHKGARFEHVGLAYLRGELPNTLAQFAQDFDIDPSLIAVPAADLDAHIAQILHAISPDMVHAVGDVMVRIGTRLQMLSLADSLIDDCALILEPFIDLCTDAALSVLGDGAFMQAFDAFYEGPSLDVPMPATMPEHPDNLALRDA